MAKPAKQQDDNLVQAISISTVSSNLSIPIHSPISSSTIYCDRIENNTSKNISQNIVNSKSIVPKFKHHPRFCENKNYVYKSEKEKFIENSKKNYDRSFGTNTSVYNFDRNNLSISLIDSTVESDDDIASIAKQISDNAEIIYQNWKARGLAPTEIFDCQISANSLRLLQTNLEYPITEFLINSPDMSNNNLKKLVNSFINEDKARQLSSGKKGDLPAVNINCTNSDYNTSITENSNNKLNSLSVTSGTIRDTLRKFESINTSSNVKPNFLTTKTFTSPSAHNFTKTNESHENNSFQNLSQLNKNLSNVVSDSIELLPNNKAESKLYNISEISSNTCETAKAPIPQKLTILAVSQSTKPQTPIKPANLINHLNQNHQLNSGVPISLSTLNSNKQKTTALPFLSKQQLPSQPSGNNSNINEGTINISKKKSGTTTTISPTVLQSKKLSTQQKKQTEFKNYEKKSIVSSNEQNNYILPSLPTSSVTNCMSNEEHLNNTQTLSSHKNKTDLLDEIRREEEHLINSLKTGVLLNKNDHFKIEKNNEDSKHKFVAHRELNSNIKNENIAQSLIACKENKNNFTEEKRGHFFLHNNNNNNRNNNNNNKIKDSLRNTSDINPISNQNELIKSSITPQVLSLATKKIEPCEKDCFSEISSSQPKEIISPITSVTNKLDINPKFTSITSNITLAPKPGSTRTKMRSKNDIASYNCNSLEISKVNKIMNPVQPFLTRGSVAERIMMFEKCPDIILSPFRHVNRETQYKPKLHAVHAMVPKSEPQSHTTLQRAVRASNVKNLYIPRFHYPHGKPLPNIAQETIIQQVKAAFDAFPNNQCTKQDFHKILKLCNIPFYWRMPLISCTQIMAGPLIDGYRFVDFWKQMSIYCHDLESRFVYILSRGQKTRPYVLPEDLTPLVQDVVDTHPGLAFLKEASEFHSRYIHTVISRIFYTVNRSWSNRITVLELRRSNLLQVIQLLEEEEDINQIMAFFSYEHFYVIYCKFWELDRDHDLFIDQNDLAQHNNHALSTRIMERIFSGCVTRGEKTRITGSNEPKMSYTDFVWFLLSEEDKTNPTSIEYWFRCMDLDGDGVISMYELEYFYEEQQERMFSLCIETLPFEDCLCQMLDMIKPKKPGCITLSDLKRCRMTSTFFDTFFNLVKYLEYEQRDPFASQKDNDEMTDWDRYAAQEYELLVAEENDMQGSYEDEEDDSESTYDINEIDSRQR